jgi:methyl-accepting chemotaxis protein
VTHVGNIEQGKREIHQHVANIDQRSTEIEQHLTNIDQNLSNIRQSVARVQETIRTNSERSRQEMLAFARRLCQGTARAPGQGV